VSERPFTTNQYLKPSLFEILPIKRSFRQHVDFKSAQRSIMAKRSPEDAVTPISGSAARNPTRSLQAPVFSQPEPTEDPKIFRVKHPSDADAYKAIDQLNKEHKLQPMAFPKPRGDSAEPRLTLTEIFGSKKAVKTIE